MVATLTSPHDGDAPPRDGTGERPVRIGALDGLRALAVIAVVAYHLWPAIIPGGFLGVDLFMVLSGFLITGLLVDERRRSGAVRLGRFWARRFRRLVPALTAVLVAVVVWVAIVESEALAATVRRQGLAALAYVGNWRLIADGVSYASLNEPPSPLLHLWSLAVEEQFYVVWPAVVVGVLAFAARRPHRSGALLVVAIGGAIASAAWMALQFDPGEDPHRLYFGTDARAQTFLVGAAAAVVSRRWIDAPNRLAVAGPVAVAVVIAAFVWGPSDGVLYRAGFAAFAVAAAFAVVAATASDGPVVWLFDRGPLRLIGRVSYGIYLWHWPAVVLLTSERVGVDGLALDVVRLLVTAAGTALSWHAIERPFARASGRRLLVGGASVVAIAAVAVVTLPSASPVPYAGVDISDVPAASLYVPGSTVAAATTTTPSPQPSASVPPPSVAPPVTAPAELALPAQGTVMLVGDSGAVDAFPAFAAGFTTAGWRVVDSTFPGIGLYTEEARASWRDAIAAHDPDLTILLLGGWDYGRVLDEGEDAYAEVVASVIGDLTASGGRVLWLSMLPGGAIPGEPMNRVYAAAAAAREGVAYLDISDSLATADRTWPRIVDGRLLRKPDSWHLCPDGAVAVAATVLRHLDIASTGWEGGSWRDDWRYDDPKGACEWPSD